jgi:FMN phosphatase YigB (HAD superfamily)
MPEAGFWEWLSKQCPTMDLVEAKSLLFNSLTPLPAATMLPIWSQIADIHLLSNHRLEWLTNFVCPIQPLVKSITISSEVGLCKPDRRIYEQVQQHLQGTGKVLFVDDQEKNLQPAVSLGWNTLHADLEGKWIKLVIPLLV